MKRALAETQTMGTMGTMGTERTTPARYALRVALVGVLPGVLSYALLFGLSLWLHSGAEYLGVEDPELERRIFSLFEAQITAQQLSFLALYSAIGALVGLTAWTYIELWRRARRRAYRGWRHLLWTSLLIWLVHSWFMVYSAHHHPAVYEPQVSRSLYLAALFWLGTDALPSWGIDAIAVAFIGAALVPAAILMTRHLLKGQGQGHALSILSVLAALVIVTLIVGVGVGLSASPPSRLAPRGRPNVLIVAVDSLRGDMLGRSPAVTPQIDRFARRAASFAEAYSVMPRTFPSWASILTGLYPQRHGVRHMFPRPVDGPIVDGALPQILRRAGYRTAVISDFAGEVFSRGDFGYEHVDAPEFTLQSNARLGGLKLHMHLMPYLIEVAEGAGSPDLMAFERLGDPDWLSDRAIDWLASADARPFFLTVFYSCGHFPFASPAPFYERFTDPAYRGPSRFHKAVFGSAPAGPEREAEERHIRGLYEGAVAASDAAIGRLFDYLDARGLLDNTVVVIAADHGEMLYEYGLGVGHGDHLYGRGTLRVPLVLSWPGLAHPGARIEGPAALIDVAPTVLARVGLVPPASVDGLDLAPAAEGERALAPDRPLFAETGLTFFPPETERLEGRRLEFAEGFSAFRYDPDTWAIYLDPAYEATALVAKHRALIEGDRKLLYIPTREGVRWELYDLDNDPGDLNDLSAREPERLAAMKARLYTWLESDPEVTRIGDFVVPVEGLGGPRAAAR